MNYYSDVWFWRASDQAAVARHLKNRPHTAFEPNRTPPPGLVRSALRLLLRVTRPVGELPAREPCGCGDGWFGYREPVPDGGEWVLRCPECGHLDRLEWLSDEARPLVVGLARRRELLRTGKTVKS